MKLKNWVIITDYREHNSNLEKMNYYLRGNVYGNPKFEDGTCVVTSKIMEINDKGEYKEAITKSKSVYELHSEDVDKGAERRFPDYYERLNFNDLKELV